MHVRSKSILYKQFYFKCIVSYIPVIYQWPITDFWNLRIVIFCLLKNPLYFAGSPPQWEAREIRVTLVISLFLKLMEHAVLIKLTVIITTWSTKLMTSFLWHLIPIQKKIKNFRALNYARVGLIVQNFSFFKF